MHQSGEKIGAGGRVSRFLRLIRFSHTIFALPFALGAFIVAANGWPSLRGFVLVVFCIFFYSVTKRFTSATHFFLGLALAIAPIGAWIAQTGRIDLAPVVLAAGVICWVAGFDLIYATQDYDFDRREDIRSLVVKLGITRSLRLAQLLHLLTCVALIG